VSIDKAIESLKSVRLRGGVFGKVTLLLIVLAIGVCTVAFKSDLWGLTLGLMLPLMGIVFYALKRTFDFAEANPQAAVMEGAELLHHEKILHAAKGQGLLLPEAPVDEAPEPILLEAAVVEPDAPPTDEADEADEGESR
jgi:hypothetical protein